MRPVELLTYAGVPATVTLLICLTLGRWLARRNRPLAILLCATILPLAGLLVAAAFLILEAMSPSGSDLAGPGIFAMVALAALSLPSSVATSLIVFAVARRRG